jgi:hypothetical protein
VESLVSLLSTTTHSQLLSLQWNHKAKSVQSEDVFECHDSAEEASVAMIRPGRSRFCSEPLWATPKLCLFFWPSSGRNFSLCQVVPFLGLNMCDFSPCFRFVPVKFDSNCINLESILPLLASVKSKGLWWNSAHSPWADFLLWILTYCDNDESHGSTRLN